MIEDILARESKSKAGKETKDITGKECGNELQKYFL